jgi:hypothetical protein
LSFPTTGPRTRGNRAATAAAILATALAAALLGLPDRSPAASMKSPGDTRIVHKPGRIVPIPKDIPHQEGARIDSRLIPNIRWLYQRFPFYVTEGYAGPLRGVGTVGCPRCHVTNSDHHYAAALDLVALDFSTSCGRRWRPITRLARWAEPRQNAAVAPFRWIGYDGDSGHGCGHHLHLSWNHAPGRAFRTASWIQVFKVQFTGVAEHPRNPPFSGGHTGPDEGSGQETGGVSARMVSRR